MANSTKSGGTVEEMPRLLSQQDPAQGSEPGQESPPPPRPKKKNGRPRQTPGDSPGIPAALGFFDRVALIPFADWGTRAKIKAYRLEPLINKLVGSEYKYICVYESKVDEDKIKVDHGSGKYRLYLSYKAAGKNGEDQLDQIDINILDPAFPPKIPAGEWMDDPRNKAWAWAKPPQAQQTSYPQYFGQQPQQPAIAQPPAPAPLETLTSTIRLANELRKEVREEIQQNAPAPAAAQQPATAAPVDPWQAAERILNMRSDNPMVTILQEELKALRASMDQQRSEVSKLQQENFQIQLKVMEERIKALSENKSTSGGIIEQTKELAALLGVEPKQILGRFLGADTGETIVKSRMSGTLEFLSDLIPKVINAPIVTAIAQRITAPPQPAPGAPAVPRPPAAQPQAPANEEQELIAWVNAAITPAMVDYLENEESGSDFAQWVFNGYPQQLPKLQNMMHHMMPNLKGAPVIIELYKHTGQLWQNFLQPREAQFRAFVEEFCAWKEEEEDGAPAAEPSSAENDGVEQISFDNGGNES